MPCTGASDGHGLLFAKQAAAFGASVAMIARGRERLEAAAATITDPPAHPITGDLADQDSIKAAADAAIEHLGGLDVLVISAANSTPEYLSEAATHEQLQRVHVLGTETLIQVGLNASSKRFSKQSRILHPNPTQIVISAACLTG